MLDLSHPMTKHIFQAAALMDGVMARGQRMSVSPSTVRGELLAECTPLFTEMRELASDKFGKRAEFILVAVDEYESAIRELAALGGGRITEDRRDGQGCCPACGTPIKNSPPLILCGTCNNHFMAAYEKLNAEEGFGTLDI